MWERERETAIPLVRIKENTKTRARNGELNAHNQHEHEFNSDRALPVAGRLFYWTTRGDRGGQRRYTQKQQQKLRKNRTGIKLLLMLLRNEKNHAMYPELVGWRTHLIYMTTEWTSVQFNCRGKSTKKPRCQRVSSESDQTAGFTLFTAIVQVFIRWPRK